MTQPNPPAPPPRAGRRTRMWPFGRRTPVASRIGLWGAQSSGKTTMLAALQIAIDQRKRDGQNWIIYGRDRRSSDFLGQQIHAIMHRQFPVATPNQARPLSFSLEKTRRESRVVRAVRRSARGHRFDLTLLDVTGEYYGTDPRIALSPDDDEPAPERRPDLFGADDGSAGFDGNGIDGRNGDHIDDLVEHLARADGIVFLFDPERELRQGGDGGDAYLYLRSMLERISRRASELGRLRDGKLPHYLAVCIAKLDEPIVFDRALKGGFVDVSDDDAATPVVTGDDARDFFRDLCTGQEAGDGPVLGAIEGHFHPRRTKYFATSSVGFHIGPGGVFRIQDYRNVVEGNAPGERQLRGRIRPINVIEPFLWLEESVRKRRPPESVDSQPSPGDWNTDGRVLEEPDGPREDRYDDLPDVDGFPDGRAADDDFEGRHGNPPPADRYGEEPPLDRYGDEPPLDRYRDEPPADRYRDEPPPDYYRDEPLAGPLAAGSYEPPVDQPAAGSFAPATESAEPDEVP